MSRFKKIIFKLISRAIISIENFQSVTSLFSKIDLILKTKNSLSIKAKKRSLDLKNKRSRSNFDDQSIRRLRSRFEHFEKNSKTRRNDKNKDKDDKKNKNDKNDRNDKNDKND